ncbi:acyl-CoA dehydrogenase family protein [Lichenicoccus sp.]|uniref:acyl-CoA dehydrogenase family protein n=1 Tax=Lichenicoccus sp. TaxID=2781899 RepID=UPI003D13FC55
MSKALLEDLAEALPAIESEADRLDREGGFPEHAFAVLRETGAMVATLPAELGGLGLAAGRLLAVLRLIGAGSLAVGRLYEGHVNALRLIAVYGSAAQLRRAAGDARAGHLFGIWVTGGNAPLRLLRDGLLEGEKRFASGALHVTRALVTALHDGAERMAIVPLGDDRRADPTLGGLHGMRAACTGRCDFTGIRLEEEALIGGPDDYLRQPEFSAGAWRGIAVALGGVDRLVALLCEQLRARGRADDPHQLTRIGEALIARETAAMWAARAADAAEGGSMERGRMEGGDIVAMVGLARIAAEVAALDVIRLVQRGLGLAGFLCDNPAERVMRDLATYLRQPAPDETLTEAAGWFSGRAMPPVR